MKTRLDKEKGNKPKGDTVFIGNTSQSEVLGLYNRKERVLGIRRVRKLAQYDITRTARERRLSFSGHGSSSLNITSKGNGLKVSANSKPISFSKSNHTLSASKKINIGSFKKVRF